MPDQAIYGLDDIHARPDALIVIVSSPRVADVARPVLSDMVVVSWIGDVHGDWSPVFRRRVVLWPDAGDDAAGVMAGLGDQIAPQTAECRIVRGTDDLSDLIAGGADASELIEYARANIEILKGGENECEVPSSASIAHTTDQAPATGTNDQTSGRTAPSKGGDADPRGLLETAQPDVDKTQPLKGGDASPPSSPRRLPQGGGALPVPAPDPDHEPDTEPDHHENVVALFRGVPIPRGNNFDDWRDHLLMNEEGRIKPRSINNVIWFMRGHPDMRGLFAYDEFARDIFLTREPVWTSQPMNGEWMPRSLRDEDITEIRASLEAWHLTPTKGDACDAVLVAARDNSVHPVKHYLESLIWDGVPRLFGGLTADGDTVEPFAVRYLGCNPGNSPYPADVCARWLISAVARIYQPGCKADCTIVLEGPQGKRKSTAVRTLGGEFFTDDLDDFGSKDAAMQVQGAWIIEFPELDATRRADTEKVKAFLSRSTDRFRLPYGRRVQEFPRQSVLAGTTNSEHYLKDTTGNRRFWPIKCGEIDIPALSADRDQIWAEAVALYRAGEKWWLTGEVAELQAVEVMARVEDDTWVSIVREFMDRRLTSTISTADLLTDALKIEPGRQTKFDAHRVNATVRMIGGWKRVKLGERGWVYERE